MRLKIYSLKAITRSFECSPDPFPSEVPSARQLEQARRLGYLVAVAASATPWNSSCLIQVLAVQRLLSNRGIVGQFCLGVNRRGRADTGTIYPFAHAWVLCGDEVVNGGCCEDFAVIASYRWMGSGL